jgi:hypothetical protein
MAASPDGRWLAFFRTGKVANAGVLVVLPVRGGQPRELAMRVHVGKADQEQLTDIVPMWTPDGRALLVERLRGATREFLLVPVDGSAPRKADIPLTGFGHRLSPDGRQLAYVVGAGRMEVWVLENFLPVKN